MSETLLNSIGVRYIDHLAVTTPVLEKTLQEYLSLPGSRMLRGPAINLTQKVKYAFVSLSEGIVIEILSPEPNSPILGLVRNGGGPYHFCYAVENIQTAIEIAISHSAKLVLKPECDVAFDGRQIAFMFHEAHGIFELVEAYPSEIELTLPQRQKIVRTNFLPKEQKMLNQVELGAQDLKLRLCGVFKKIFFGIDENEITIAEISKTNKWDSLSHIGLMMEIESEFGLDLLPDDMAKLISFELILSYLNSKNDIKKV